MGRWGCSGDHFKVAHGNSRGLLPFLFQDKFRQMPFDFRTGHCTLIMTRFLFEDFQLEFFMVNSFRGFFGLSLGLDLYLIKIEIYLGMYNKEIYVGPVI